ELQRASELARVGVLVRGVAVPVVAGQLPRSRTQLVQRSVDDRPPDPGLQGSFAAEGGTLAHRGRECVLDGVSRSVRVADDSGGDATVFVEAASVDLLDVAERRRTAPAAEHPHASMTLRRRPLL